MPAYAIFFMLFPMASIGLPGTSGFVGEFLSLAGIYEASSWAAFTFTTGIILGAAYMPYLYRRVVFSAWTKEHVQTMAALSPRESATFVTRTAGTMRWGGYPTSLLAPKRGEVTTGGA